MKVADLKAMLADEDPDAEVYVRFREYEPNAQHARFVMVPIHEVLIWNTKRTPSAHITLEVQRAPL
jgi:hypothetical protein